MRSILAVSLLTTAAFLSACASQEKAPAATSKSAKKAPECWNGDMGAFQPVGTKTTLSGVAVECKPTSDGKAAQWVGVNAKH